MSEPRDEKRSAQAAIAFGMFLVVAVALVVCSVAIQWPKWPAIVVVSCAIAAVAIVSFCLGVLAGYL